jgi:hypothetical protein
VYYSHGRSLEKEFKQHREKMMFLVQKSSRDDMLIKGLEDRDTQAAKGGSADKKQLARLTLICKEKDETIKKQQECLRLPSIDTRQIISPSINASDLESLNQALTLENLKLRESKSLLAKKLAKAEMERLQYLAEPVAETTNTRLPATKSKISSGEDAKLKRKLELALDEVHALKEGMKNLSREKARDVNSFQELNASLRESLKRELGKSTMGNESFPPAV